MSLEQSHGFCALVVFEEDRRSLVRRDDYNRSHKCLGANQRKYEPQQQGGAHALFRALQMVYGTGSGTERYPHCSQDEPNRREISRC